MIERNVLLLGDGRLAGHLQYVLESHSQNWLQWTRKHSFSDLEQLGQRVDLALLAVSDGAIDELAQRLPASLPKIHFSGVLNSKHAIGVHPLMTFSKELFPLSFYSKIPLVLDPGALELEWIQKLPNPKQLLSPKDKALYHAICHLVGNFPKLIWQESFQALENSTSLSREMFLPYLEQTLHQVLNNEADLKAGPFGRQDQKTIALHQSELLKHPLLHKLYSNFQNSFHERFYNDPT